MKKIYFFILLCFLLSSFGLKGNNNKRQQVSTDLTPSTRFYSISELYKIRNAEKKYRYLKTGKTSMWIDDGTPTPLKKSSSFWIE